MKRMLTLSQGALILPRAFANANAKSTVWISTTSVATGDMPLAKTALEALEYTQIKGIGNHGETGPNTNILTYDTWDIEVIQKAKGMTDAGSPEIEVARIVTDPGQIALRAAAKTNLNYAFKMVRNDAPEGGTATTLYNVGLVTGPRRPHGRNEDFDLEIFALALNQLEVVVDAAGV